MVEVSEKVLDDCKSWLIATSKAWTAGVCKGKTVYIDGKEEGKDIAMGHTACHSWVTSSFGKVCLQSKNEEYYWNDWNTPYSANARNFLTLNCHSKVRSKTVCSPEATDFLVLWMAKESPFSQFVLNRDDDRSLTEGGVILLCGPDGLTLSQAVWVCKVLRFITEGAKAADTFMTLVKGGVDPMLAVLVASHVRSIKGAVFGYTGVEGHSTVFSAYYYQKNAEPLLGLLTRTLNPKASNTTEVFQNPEGIKVPRLEKATDKIKSFCKPFKKSDGWGGYVQGVGADASDLVTRVLQWQAELGQLLPDYDATFPPVLQPDPPMPDSNTVYLELDL